MTNEQINEQDWFTFAELAERWGTTVAAVRMRSKRERWPRQEPNRVGVSVRVRPPNDEQFTERRRRREMTPVNSSLNELQAELATAKQRLADAEATAKREVVERARLTDVVASLSSTIASNETAAREERSRLLTEVDRLSAELREARLPWLVRVVRAFK